MCWLGLHNLTLARADGGEGCADVSRANPAKLFRVEGQNRGFDATPFLGDPVLAVFEEAWAALDGL